MSFEYNINFDFQEFESFKSKVKGIYKFEESDKGTLWLAGAKNNEELDLRILINSSGITFLTLRENYSKYWELYRELIAIAYLYGLEPPLTESDMLKLFDNIIDSLPAVEAIYMNYPTITEILFSYKPELIFLLKKGAEYDLNDIRTKILNLFYKKCPKSFLIDLKVKENTRTNIKLIRKCNYYELGVRTKQ